MLSASEVQKRYGVGKPQVSRWRTHTAPERIDEYRQRIIDAARLAAELKAKANLARFLGPLRPGKAEIGLASPF
jgi:hypothetical protein